MKQFPMPLYHEKIPNNTMTYAKTKRNTFPKNIYIPTKYDKINEVTGSFMSIFFALQVFTIGLE
ncbi:hypothetical protein CEW92_05505 [Bacillaceae bacterium SAS-127]|nr:hypothetical protein CEW92_05505 [Bacillaceae bacterium SAS-127]